MSDCAIRARQLGKVYRLGQRETYKALRDGASAALRALTTRRAARRVADKQVWAVRDVTFDIGHGEVVGFVGRNGAGKSTLLKILSRITEPTEGAAEIHGRVGSLLEVGTGFHPELTGRENVYLNGAILGMKRAEIRRKFDEIVDFAGIDRFIDTPVKRYSSGMYVRLAFAVAAHLETEILLVDEVLAVGDTAFQKKCLGKMGDIAKQGRTVLFVSHDMGAIHQLCNRALLFQGGRLCSQGTPQAVIADYLTDATRSANGDFDFSRHPARAAQHQPIIRRVTLRAAGGAPTALFYPDDSLEVDLLIDPPHPIRGPRLAVAIEDNLGRRIMTLASYFEDRALPDLEARCRIRCTVPRLGLGSGQYLVSVSIGTKRGDLLDMVNSGAWFEVGWRNNFGNGEPYHPVYGPVLGRSTWQWVD